MRKGIIGLLLVIMVVSIGSTALAAPSMKGSEARNTAEKWGIVGIPGVIEEESTLY